MKFEEYNVFNKDGKSNCVIIDNILYDKDNSSSDLYSIKLYKKQ